MSRLICAQCMAEEKQKGMMDFPENPPDRSDACPDRNLTMFAGQYFCWQHLPVQAPMTDMEQQRHQEIGDLFNKFFGGH